MKLSLVVMSLALVVPAELGAQPLADGTRDVGAPVTTTTATEETVPTGSAFIVGAKLGGIVPLDGLSPFVSGGIEVGYTLAGGRIAIIGAIDYTQPTTNESESDPRVTGGMYTWQLTEQELGVMVTAVYRLTSMRPLVPYAGIGPRVVFLRSTVQASGAPTFMKTTEQSTGIGVGIPVGAELRAGPGSLIGELLLQYGTLDHVATGESHTGALSLSVGYRMFL